LLIVGSIWTKDWVEQHGSAIENPGGNGPADNGPATRSLTPPQPVDAAREQQLKQKIAEQEAAHGPDDPGLARTLVDLAVLYRSTGRYEAAEGLCKRALAIQQTALGPKDPDTIRTLKELATIYRLEGRTRDADQILSKLEQR
jgi:tetratricopeptide (TPR) repeat protein